MPIYFRKPCLLGLTLTLLLVSTGFHAQPSLAQPQQVWSPQQQAVWKAVEGYSTASKNRNLDTYLSYFHPDFAGWHNGDDAPTTRSERATGLAWYFENSKPLSYAIEPLAIQVAGATAVVHYKIEQTLHWSNGEENTGTSYWTDVLVQENNRWLLFSDHGGAVAE